MEIVNLVNDKCQVIDLATGQIIFEGSYDDCFICLATYEDEDILLFDDSLYDNTYGVTTFIVDSVSYNFVTTEITLTDLSVTTTATVVGNITYGIVNWAGGYPIGGQYSHAEGEGTVAVGVASHAEGVSTIAVGSYSHAEGNSTEASGESSHAEGESTQAIGIGSHAEGFYTVASGSYQHVQGQYNISSSVESAFIIGNGIDDSNRSNLVFASGSQFQVTGSLAINDILQLSRRTTNPANPVEGMIIASGSAGASKLYYYNGTTWNALF